MKTILQRDLAITEKIDPAYAERFRQRIATRFLDTNEFSLSDIPPEERMLIGAATTRRLGSGHNPHVARTALEESRAAVEALVDRYAATILIATGGKGTGAGTIFPIAEMARRRKKLVIPIFVCPSFERHEVEKRRYDHARRVVEQFDRAGIRLIEILNDRGYTDREPLPQSVVWERMNLPIARSLRGLLYVLEDLSQVDPSDLSVLFAGPGRLRLAFAGIDPAAGGDPTAEQIDDAVRACWENPYDAFGKTAGTSLICIQGHWSNVVDARIKGRFRSVVADTAGEAYNPLYARAIHMPKPWGVTALFAEHTGTHRPIEIAWPLEDHEPPAPIPSFAVIETPVPVDASEPQASAVGTAAPEAISPAAAAPVEAPAEMPTAAAYFSMWEFARALNRGDAAAHALAKNGVDPAVRIDTGDLRKLLTAVWFRAAFDALSQSWRDRLFETVKEMPLTNYVVRIGRHNVLLSDATPAQLHELAMRTDLREAVRSDVQVLTAIDRFWGSDALRRCHLVDEPVAASSRLDLARVRSVLLG